MTVIFTMIGPFDFPLIDRFSSTLYHPLCDTQTLGSEHVKLDSRQIIVVGFNKGSVSRQGKHFIATDPSLRFYTDNLLARLSEAICYDTR